MNNNTIPADVVDYLESYFETFNTLPTKTLQCNETGIAYTAFGSNLQKKIEKAGSIRELLTGFVGRGAKAKVKTTGKSGRVEAKVTIKTT
jgi:hypothetical protein